MILNEDETLRKICNMIYRPAKLADFLRTLKNTDLLPTHYSILCVDMLDTVRFIACCKDDDMNKSI